MCMGLLFPKHPLDGSIGQTIIDPDLFSTLEPTKSAETEKSHIFLPPANKLMLYNDKIAI